MQATMIMEDNDPIVSLPYEFENACLLIYARRSFRTFFDRLYADVNLSAPSLAHAAESLGLAIDWEEV